MFSKIFPNKTVFLSNFVNKNVFLTQKCNHNQLRRLTVGELNEIYQKTRQLCQSKKPPKDVNPKGVFSCNELDLKEVNVYGFDYDFTLACYKTKLDYLLYDLGKNILVNDFKYPKEISKLNYLPDFAIRGLHYDIEKGLLLKLDTFLQVQLGTVYRGLTPVPDEGVLQLYKQRIIPQEVVDQQYKHPGSPGRLKLYQLADLFSVPEVTLLCNITEFFEKNHINYLPEILFHDVRKAVQSSHPIMHKELLSNIDLYLESNPGIRKLLHRLKEAEKKLFLVTNSPFKFVEAGMSVIVGSDWTDFFDVIIVQARKPLFFTDDSRPIRVYDRKTDSQLWDRVTKLQKGVIYLEGTVRQLQDMTGWTGRQVLYFGDHPFSDLADVTLEYGWRTGAIIHELQHEINSLNNPKFKFECNWLQMLTQIIEDYQDYYTNETRDVFKQWIAERDHLRLLTKKVFNPQFGSVFRTYHNPTYFSRRLFRFADIYTSDITNLLNYSIHHTFYPRRGALPHEYSSLFM